ncbi:phosphoribosyl-dephospho-CoA transferase [Alteribacillus persepolensis]|uniref:Phosphoribosyl-dephospho-CoA transferase n=1 Tax=Alteribacillus persepolensis TaxID=568899 RepID=A0A1G8EAA0_9BACI|nr:malonate decarboxylase holo-ACP synthase [Alteribacillus persepolensis]SDH66862.1 phosphoribosyl-dephospho-CoA transferase [Alteribacillus persepolensis]
MEIRPHDLLAFEHMNDLLFGETPPGWVKGSVAKTPYVVVRRAPITNNCVPVGMRGTERSHRLKALLPLDKIKARYSPEYITKHRLWHEVDKKRLELPVLKGLDAMDRIFSGEGLSWGVTGSAGFELVTGIHTVSISSDLDVIVRTNHMMLETAMYLYEEFQRLPFRVDVHMEGQAGAFALNEYVQNTGKILLRTKQGPQLVFDPWKQEEKAVL